MKTKVLISFAVAAKLICTFDLAQAFCWFSHAVAHIKFGQTDSTSKIFRERELSYRNTQDVVY